MVTMPDFFILGGELLLALPVTVIVHELGHWRVARRVGFRARSFTAGLLSIVWAATRRQVRLRWRTLLGGGLVLVDPSADTQLGRRASWFAVGGILANLGMALLFAVGALVRRYPRRCMGSLR
jgi:hypothetical protein